LATSAELLLDTSAAVALVLPDHEHHAAVRAASTGRRLGLAGHAVFETFSVLTRLPAGVRLAPADAQRVIGVDFPASVTLRMATASALAELVRAGATGGQVYDGLVGLAAREAGLPLLSFDARARDLYLALAVRLA
jgi:predicted nucleic acid-binding protein